MDRKKLYNKRFEYKKPVFIPHCQYQVVANDIIRKIHDGVYLPGEKLEGVRTLAARYKKGRQIILSAFNELSRRGFVYSEARRGVFVNSLLVTGRFYRLGFFFFYDNPAGSGMMINSVFKEALARNYEMILGTSHEGESDFREWLDRKRDLDGVLVTGYATDEDLQELVRRRLPYMVMGNLDIDSAHPQERIDLVLGIKNAVLPRLCPFAGKRVAALISSALFSAARETAEGIKEALRDAGAVFDERLIMHCEGDGYQETARLLSEFKPDVVYVHGETYSGYARYFRLHQKMARPYTIVNTNGRFVAARDICDESFFCDLYSDEVIRLAVNGLFAQINRVTK